MLISDNLDAIADGDAVDLDLDAGELRLSSKNQTVQLEPLPDNLRRMLADGGLVPHLKKRFATERKRETGQ